MTDRPSQPPGRDRAHAPVIAGCSLSPALPFPVSNPPLERFSLASFRFLFPVARHLDAPFSPCVVAISDARNCFPRRRSRLSVIGGFARTDRRHRRPLALITPRRPASSCPLRGFRVGTQRCVRELNRCAAPSTRSRFKGSTRYVFVSPLMRHFRYHRRIAMLCETMPCSRLEISWSLPTVAASCSVLHDRERIETRVLLRGEGNLSQDTSAQGKEEIIDGIDGRYDDGAMSNLRRFPQVPARL